MQKTKHYGLCNKHGQTIREVLRRLVEQDRLRNAPADRLPVELTEGLAGEENAEMGIRRGFRRRVPVK